MQIYKKKPAGFEQIYRSFEISLYFGQKTYTSNTRFSHNDFECKQYKVTVCVCGCLCILLNKINDINYL